MAFRIRDGVVLASALLKKTQTYPELVVPGGRARLVVLALEVGGRWSQEASTFVKLLAKAKPVFWTDAWSRRGGSIMACAVRSFASSLLGLRGGHEVPPRMRLSAIFTTQDCGVIRVALVGD